MRWMELNSCKQSLPATLQKIGVPCHITEHLKLGISF